jgi:hypothetical protein
MGRKRRDFVAQQLYLTCDGSQKNDYIVLDQQDQDTLRDLAAQAAAAVGLSFLRILVRENGFLHLLRAPSGKAVSEYHRRVKGYYSRYLNQRYHAEPERLIHNIPFGQPLPKSELARHRIARETNFRPRFHATAVTEEALIKVAEAGWKVDDVSAESIEIKGDSEYLRALECVLEDVAIPKSDSPAPAKHQAAPPLRAKNSPHWALFLRPNLANQLANAVPATVKQQQAHTVKKPTLTA